MAGSKIEHSLADKARAFEELQQRAERFQQFTRSFNKEIVSAGQQFMQFYGDFLRVTGGNAGPASTGTGPAAPAGMMTNQAREFSEAVNRTTGNATSTNQPKSAAEVILMSERIRRRNAIQAGTAPIKESLFADPQMIADANRSIITENLSRATSQNQAMAEDSQQQFMGTSRNPEKRRRQAMIEMYGGRVTQQQALKGRLLEKFPEFRELQDPLSSKPELTAADRRRAEALAATGKGSHFQYDVTDIPAAMQLTQKFDKEKQDLGKRIEQLRSGGAGGDTATGRTIATALENVVRRMDVSNNRFAEAVSTFNKVAADPKVKEDSVEFKSSLNELRHAIEELTDTNQDLNRTNKAATQFGGGPGGGPPPSLFERLRPYTPYATAAFGAITAGGMVAMRTGLAMDEAIVGAERRGVTARGAIASRIAEREMAAHDMTNPENLLRYRADLMFGKKYGHIGTQPDSLMRAAREEIQDSLNVDRQRMYMGIAGAAASATMSGAQAIGGGLMLAGGTAGAAVTGGSSLLATGMGVGMIGQGVQGVANAFGTGIDAAAQNRYLQLTQGGLEGGMLGRIWRGRAETDRRAQFLQSAAKAETTRDMLGVIDQLQEAEIREKHSRDLPVMEERQRMIDVQQQGSILVGEYAVRREGFLDSMYGAATPTQARLDKHARDQQLVEMYPTGSGVAEAVATGRRNLRKEFAQVAIQRNSVLNTVKGWFGADSVEEMDRRKEELSRQIRGSKPDAPDWRGLVESAEHLKTSQYYHPLGGEGYLTSGYGERVHPVTGKVHMHAGLDLGTGGKNLPVYAAAKGQVKSVGFNPIAGNYIELQANDGTVHRYNHLQSKPEMSKGQLVNRAQELGKVGTTGRSTGVHLDYRVYRDGAPIDPRSVIDFGQGLVAPEAPINPFETVAGRLEMAPSEFMSHMNMLTNVLGNRRTARAAATTEQGRMFGIEGVRAGMDDTERLVQLGRSGLGDFQSLLGNIASLNRVAGGQNNINQLEGVLAGAVQAGFDKSRTAQMFVQTSTELAKSLNLTNVSGVAQVLSRSAQMMSPTGIADERSLAMAAQGIQTYGQFTNQKGGLVGALRTAQVFGAGGMIGGGAATLMGMSGIEASEALMQLQSGEITNPKLNRILQMQGGNKSAVASQIKGLREGSNQMFRSIYGAFGGDVDVSKRLSEIKEAQTAGNTERAEELQQKFLAHAHETGELMGIGGFGGEAAAMQIMADEGVVSQEVSAEAIEAKRRAGMETYEDPAKKNIRKYLDGLMKDFRGNTKGYSLPEYEKYIDAGGQHLTFGEGSKYAGQAILPTRAREDKEYAAETRKALSQVDTFELVRGAEIQSAQFQGDVQSVRVTNATEIALYLAEFQRVGRSTAKKQDHNK